MAITQASQACEVSSILIARSIIDMKQKSNVLVLITLTCAMLSSCALFVPGYSEYSSARRHFERGDYDPAVIAVINSLRYKPEDESRIALLEMAYPLAVEGYKYELQRLEGLNNTSKWPQTVRAYEALQRLGRAVNMIKPVLLRRANYALTLNVPDYTSSINLAKPKAADHHYQQGLLLKKEQTKQKQKSAAIQFKLAMSFVADYKNSSKLYSETRDNAIFTLMVSTFEGDQDLANFLRDKLMMAQTEPSNEFLRIVSRDQLRTIMAEQGLVQAGITKNDFLEVGQLTGADHILSASITTTYRPLEKINNHYDQEREVIIRKETYTDTAGVKQTKQIKGKVKAKVRHFKKSTGGTMTVNYQIIDINTGGMLFKGSIGRKDNFQHEWATYRGDKRALSDQYKKLVKRGEIFAPSQSDMMMKMAQSIPSEFKKKIQAHYSY